MRISDLTRDERFGNKLLRGAVSTVRVTFAFVSRSRRQTDILEKGNRWGPRSEDEQRVDWLGAAV